MPPTPSSTMAMSNRSFGCEEKPHWAAGKSEQVILKSLATSYNDKLQRRCNNEQQDVPRDVRTITPTAQDNPCRRNVGLSPSRKQGSMRNDGSNRGTSTCGSDPPITDSTCPRNICSLGSIVFSAGPPSVPKSFILNAREDRMLDACVISYGDGI